LVVLYKEQEGTLAKRQQFEAFRCSVRTVYYALSGYPHLLQTADRSSCTCTWRAAKHAKLLSLIFHIIHLSATLTALPRPGLANYLRTRVQTVYKFRRHHCVIMTDKLHFSLLVCFNNHPLHVSNRLTIHHQEVLYCICSIWYVSCIYVG